MATPETEIVVEDPTAPADDSPSVVSTRTVEIVVSLMLLALAVLLGYDNWRTGIAWASDGPQAGYFPFYLGLILAAAKRDLQEVMAEDDRMKQRLTPGELAKLFEPMAYQGAAQTFIDRIVGSLQGRGKR